MLKGSGKWIAALIAAALAVTGVGIFLALRPSEKNRAEQKSSPPTTTSSSSREVLALGRLEPEGEIYKVAPPSSSTASSRVLQTRVKENDSVKQGQVIAVMDVYERLLASALQAQAQVQEAQSELAQVRAGAKQGDISAQEAVVRQQGAAIEQQEAALRAKTAEVVRLNAELQIAEQQYKRFRALYDERAISASRMDEETLKLEQAKWSFEQASQEKTQQEKLLAQTNVQLQEALSRLNSVAEVRPTDVQQAEARVQVAMANMRRAEEDLKTAAVPSPIDGQVIKVCTKSGEQVMLAGTSGQQDDCTGAVAIIGKTSQMYAVAEIYESDIGRVKVGQKAIVTSDSAAFPNELTGKVVQVGRQIRKKDVLDTDPAADTDARVVEVKVKLDNSTPVSGLTNLQVKVRVMP